MRFPWRAHKHMQFTFRSQGVVVKMKEGPTDLELPGETIATTAEQKVGELHLM